MRRWWRYWITDVAIGGLLWLLHRAFRTLPTSWSSAFGGFVGRKVASRVYRTAHNRAAATLKALRPDLANDPSAFKALLERVWDDIGRTHAEFSSEDRLWSEGRVLVEGKEYVIGEGPLIVAGLHLGNWELLPIALGYLGHRIIDVYEPRSNRFIDRIAMQTRLRAAHAVGVATKRKVPDIFTLVAPSPRAGAELTRAVRAGWTMMMYVDEVIRGKTHTPAFGGALAKEGNLLRIVRLARLTKARIVPAYVERKEDARFVVHFLPPLAIEQGLDETQLNTAIAAPVRRHLDQWFMLLTYKLRKGDGPTAATTGELSR